MANIKEVFVCADVPFDWLQGLTAREAKVYLAWTCAPSSGMELEYEGGSWLVGPNEHGGHTTMYRVIISGKEAMNSSALALLLEPIRRLVAKGEATVHDAVYRDIQFEVGEWWEIPTVRQDNAMKRRVKREVAKTLEGKVWVHRDLGDGVTESTLVDAP